MSKEVTAQLMAGENWRSRNLAAAATERASAFDRTARNPARLPDGGLPASIPPISEYFCTFG